MFCFVFFFSITSWTCLFRWLSCSVCKIYFKFFRKGIKLLYWNSLERRTDKISVKVLQSWLNQAVSRWMYVYVMTNCSADNISCMISLWMTNLASSCSVDVSYLAANTLIWMSVHWAFIFWNVSAFLLPDWQYPSTVDILLCHKPICLDLIWL